MGFTGEQVNTYAPSMRRLLLMDVTIFGLLADT